MSILLMYHTVDGHTKAIAQYIQRNLQQQGQNCVVASANTINAAEMAACDVLVLGASIRYGKHPKAVYQFVQQHAAILQSKPSVFFSVNAVARKVGKDTVAGNPYVRKFLQQVPWQPTHTAVFAGKIDYPRYAWLDKQVIRCIMHITGGPTNTNTCFELTNWQAVDTLAQKIAYMAA